MAAWGMSGIESAQNCPNRYYTNSIDLLYNQPPALSSNSIGIGTKPRCIL